MSRKLINATIFDNVDDQVTHTFTRIPNKANVEIDTIWFLFGIDWMYYGFRARQKYVAKPTLAYLNTKLLPSSLNLKITLQGYFYSISSIIECLSMLTEIVITFKVV